MRGDVGRSGGHAVHWREAALRGGGLDEDFTVPRALGMVGIRLLGRGGKSHGEFCGGDGILGLEAGDRAVAERGAGVGVGARDARARERLCDGSGARRLRGERRIPVRRARRLETWFALFTRSTRGRFAWRRKVDSKKCYRPHTRGSRRFCLRGKEFGENSIQCGQFRVPKSIWAKSPGLSMA